MSLILGIERFYASEIYLTILCRNFFCLSAEKFRRGTFLICVSEKIWYRIKIMDKRGGGGGREYHDFLSKIFCLTVPKHFVGETFSVSQISGIERLYASESYATIFCRNFFCLSAEKLRRGNLSDLCIRKILVSKKIMDKRGGGRKEEGVSRF